MLVSYSSCPCARRQISHSKTWCYRPWGVGFYTSGIAGTGIPGCVTAHVEEVAILSEEWVLGSCACLEDDALCLSTFHCGHPVPLCVLVCVGVLSLVLKKKTSKTQPSLKTSCSWFWCRAASYGAMTHKGLALACVPTFEIQKMLWLGLQYIHTILKLHVT